MLNRDTFEYYLNMMEKSETNGTFEAYKRAFFEYCDVRMKDAPELVREYRQRFVDEIMGERR